MLHAKELQPWKLHATERYPMNATYTKDVDPSVIYVVIFLSRGCFMPQNTPCILNFLGRSNMMHFPRM
jgi:hypothetical protein